MEQDTLIAEALSLHQAGESKKAEKAYKIAIQSHPKDKRLYCNLAALVRADSRPEEAGAIANKGLEAVGQESPALLNTLGNCLRDMERHAEAINCYRRALKQEPNYFDAKLSLLSCFEDLQLNSLANITLIALLREYGLEKRALTDRLIRNELNLASQENRDIRPAVESWFTELQKLSEKESLKMVPDHWFQASLICVKNRKYADAYRYHEKGVDALNRYESLKVRKLTDNQISKLRIISCWNFSCHLLRAGDFKKGWKLYDYGLVTPAEGAQRWQRSLYKPFSQSRLPIWKGENLQNKHLLLLGEQGIGDMMMFITCIPKLIKEGAKITLVITQRLESIYSKSLTECNVISEKKMKKEPPDSQEFDFQCPLGSILQYRFLDIKDYGKDSLLLKPNQKNVQALREKYGTEKPLIGISWWGGGRGNRIREKSLDPKAFCKALLPIKARFISLQYGDDEKIVKGLVDKFGIDLVDDPDIQAMKDMETWIDQVAACDAVISIANTTIHGAGGLGKPTLCMLGVKSDWRWLDDNKQTHSYWYPTVEIARQDSTNKSWDKALGEILDWWNKQKMNL